MYDNNEKIVQENEEEKLKELKRKKNRERQRAYYHRQKDLKKKEKIEKVPKSNAERQRIFRQRRKAEKFYMDMKRQKLDSNQENIVQCRAVEYIENVMLQKNQFHSQQLQIYEQHNECITPEVILHRNTGIPGDDDADLNSDDDLSTDELGIEHEVPDVNFRDASGREGEANKTHDGYQCHECSGDIYGFRYTCMQCADYDLCSACEARGAHARHYVLRVPGPRPHLEVLRVVSAIRRELFGEAEEQPSYEPEMLRVEIKEECEDPLDDGDDDFTVVIEEVSNPVASTERDIVPQVMVMNMQTGVVTADEIRHKRLLESTSGDTAAKRTTKSHASSTATSYPLHAMCILTQLPIHSEMPAGTIKTETETDTATQPVTPAAIQVAKHATANPLDDTMGSAKQMQRIKRNLKKLTQF